MPCGTLNSMCLTDHCGSDSISEQMLIEDCRVSMSFHSQTYLNVKVIGINSGTAKVKMINLCHSWANSHKLETFCKLLLHIQNMCPFQGDEHCLCGYKCLILCAGNPSLCACFIVDLHACHPHWFVFKAGTWLPQKSSFKFPFAVAVGKTDHFRFRLSTRKGMRLYSLIYCHANSSHIPM